MKEWIIAVPLTLLTFPAFPDSAMGCSPRVAQYVEEKLDYLVGWREFSDFYSTYKNCDQSALSYAFTQKIAVLAQSAEAIPELGKEVRKSPVLRRAVLRHLASEAVSVDQANQIHEAVTLHCPVVEKRLCDAIDDSLAAAAMR